MPDPNAAPETPPAAPAPPPATPPPPSPAAAAPPAAPPEDSKRFMKRVDQVARQKAAELAKEALGMSLEEAKAKLAAASAPPPPTVPSANASAETKKIAAERDRLAKEVQKHKAEAAKIKATADANERELRNELVEGKVMSAARDAGVAPASMNYAMYAFQQAQAAVEEELDLATFYATFKTAEPQHFQAAPSPGGAPAAPPPVNTAPPASGTPGGAPPTPAPPGAPPPGENVKDLEGDKFIEQTHAKYGFRMPRY